MVSQQYLFVGGLGVIMGILAVMFAGPIFKRDKATAEAAGLIKVAGHNQFYERLVPIAIVAGTTAMSAIASYVFAETQITDILNNPSHTSAAEYVIFMLVAATGVLIDTAMIVSASRFLMHLLRGDRGLKWLTGAMFFFCLTIESGTLTYFFYLADPGPLTSLATLITNIHNVLYFVRDVLLPLTIAFFVTCVRPIIISAKDRMDATYARASQAMAALEQTITSMEVAVTVEMKKKAMASYISQLHIMLYAHPGAKEEIEAEKAKAYELIEHLKTENGYVSEAELNALVRKDALNTLLADHNSTVQDAMRNELEAMDANHVTAIAAVEQRVLATVDAIRQDVIAQAEQIVASMQEQLNTAIEQMSQHVLSLAGTSVGGRSANFSTNVQPSPRRNPMQSQGEESVALPSRRNPAATETGDPFLDELMGGPPVPTSTAKPKTPKKTKSTGNPTDATKGS